MHIHWGYLSEAERAEINGHLDEVRWPGDYVDSQEECACRAFQHWGMAYIHGMPGRVVTYDPRAVLPIDLLFSEIYTGERASRLIADGTVTLRHPSRAHPPAAPARPPSPSMAFRAGVATARMVRGLLAA
jgi:hypothetical protein